MFRALLSLMPALAVPVRRLHKPRENRRPSRAAVSGHRSFCGGAQGR